MSKIFRAVSVHCTLYSNFVVIEFMKTLMNTTFLQAHIYNEACGVRAIGFNLGEFILHSGFNLVVYRINYQLISLQKINKFTVFCDISILRVFRKNCLTDNNFSFRRISGIYVLCR